MKTTPSIREQINLLLSRMKVEEYGTTPQSETLDKILALITQRCIEARIEEVKKIWSYAREHTITDIEMIEHHTGLDFIEAVDTKHLEDRIAALSKEGE
jgi:hypothetical protein